MAGLRAAGVCAAVAVAIGCSPAPPAVPRLAKTEVTVVEFAACVTARNCAEPKTTWPTCNWADRGGRANHPVNCVDWTQADRYCKSVGGRLPTEEEWLEAVKGVKDAGVARCAKRDGSGTCPVGSHPGDADDLLANVKEWTSSAAALPGGVVARVVRGAGWDIDPLGDAPESGLTNRETLPPDAIAADLGFRCVVSAR